MFNKRFIYLQAQPESASAQPENVDAQIDSIAKRITLYGNAEQVAVQREKNNDNATANRIRNLIRESQDADKILTATQPGESQETADAQSNALNASREILRLLESINERGISFAQYEAKYKETRRYLEGFATGTALKDADVSRDIYQTEAQDALSKMDDMVDPAVFNILRESDKQSHLQALNNIMNSFSSEAGESIDKRKGAGTKTPEWLANAMNPMLENERATLKIRGNGAVSSAVGRVIDKGLGELTQTVVSGNSQTTSDLPGNWSVDLTNINDVETNVKKELLKVSSVDLSQFEDGYTWNIDDRGINVKIVKQDVDNDRKPIFDVQVVSADKDQYAPLAAAVENRKKSSDV